MDCPVVDLGDFISHDYDQGRMESCTANVLCSAYGLELKKQHMKDARFHYFEPSRLFVYYNARAYLGCESQNSPVPYREAIKSIHKIGVCHESMWPYDFNSLNKKPSSKAYEDAKGNTISRYERLNQDLHQFKACLKSGCPFIMGIEIYPAFHELEKKGNDGVLKPPSKDEVGRGVLGLHAVLVVGYNDHKKQFKVLNSYGDDFGIKGYFFVSYDYILDSNRCFDFWKIVHSTEGDVKETIPPSD